MKGIVDY